MTATLGVVAAPAAGHAREMLRVVAGLVASGCAVRLVVRSSDALSDPDDDEVARTLEILADLGVVAERVDAAALVEAVAAATSLVACLPPDRPRDPPLLVVDGAAIAEARAAPEAFVAGLLRAGQVVRAP